jgi:hypothetical protein
MTGLLYLIVIVMWAAVLFPIFLKRHDQVQVHKAVGLKKQLTGLRWQKRVAPTARQQAFIRRRRVLMSLLTATIATLLAGLSGIISLIWTAVPVVFLVTFVFAAIKNGHKIVAIPDVPGQQLIEREVSTQAMQTTVAIPLAVNEQLPVAQTAPATWQPVEPPMPAYVRASRATAVPRALDAEKPWTGQDMVEHATRLRQQHAQRIQEAKKRLEEARALSMEKARRAALSVRPIEAAAERDRAANE